MARKKATRRKKTVKVESLRHKDKRKNIPTEELRDFVKEDESRPQEVKYPGLLYARDPSLDPQLVWKGKDEQDRAELAVPSVPIYIQEKIHPQVIVEDVRRAAQEGKPRQADLFSDFNDLPQEFDKRVDFYHYEGNWSNRMILGDSLLVMTSLAEKEGLRGKVQTIYIDPPYGIKFGSNWQVSTRKRDVRDGKAADLTRQPEQIRAFRDTWELGIHSYLAYWRDRLVLARELLTESGSIFVQIGDENVHLVRSLMDEVFGADNFAGIVAIRKTGGFSTDLLSLVCDWLVWYAKKRESAKFRPLYTEKRQETVESQYDLVELADGSTRQLAEAEVAGAPFPAGAKRMMDDNLMSQGQTQSGSFNFDFRDVTYSSPAGYHWKTTETGVARLGEAGRLIKVGNWLKYRRYLKDYPVAAIDNIWADVVPSTYSDTKIYVVQTATRIIERCTLMTTDPGDLVLDPTCGSGTTAYVAEQWGRRWITIDTSRVALALARTRLMAGRYPYYLLADSPEGVEKEAEIAGELPPPAKTRGDIKKGFVYKRVPHITLKSIANNEEIDKIHQKWQEQLEPIREKINKAVGKQWQEWEIPREIPNPKSEIRNLLAEWWELRRKCQAEIDASIARRADTEMLYDRPYEDNKRIRVTGPFTVESLSPHRTISVEEKKRREEVGTHGWKVKEFGPNQFGNIIIENLKKAGVQNTIKNERLKFDRLEAYAGTWIHAAGEYTERDGATRRVAVCIGPEHGTVGTELVKEAAKEAVQGVGFDLLIVCGFAFDPHVSEETKRYGKLTVLPARINADLQMGDEFLKKSGAANLFTVFGEPDLEVRKQEDGKAVVEIKGLDIYDPTTGEIRSNSTDDIACWFIDTDYNGESFFVRHAYFTGAGQPYDKLKRALRAQIDEAAWSALYSAKSRPFDPPKSGKIAVKVINHYGDEVLKVYSIAE